MNNPNNPDTIKSQNGHVKCRQNLKELSRREDSRPMRDMLIWLGLILFFAFLIDFYGAIGGNYTTLRLLGVI